MLDGVAARIAERALAQVGTPFRLHGRKPGVALDCVGLVVVATGVKAPDPLYSLKGATLASMTSYMDGLKWKLVDRKANPHDGDVTIVQCATDQLHLMIRAAGGWVHSHAGLRKVVHTPGDSPWPIVALRRPSGD